MPKRIQRKRTKGWRMPEGAVYVGRPSKWGNPYYPKMDDDYNWFVMLEDATGPIQAELAASRSDAMNFSAQFFADDSTTGDLVEYPFDQVKSELAGRDLACWCPLDDGHGNRVPCHADVLLELANEESDL